MRHEPLRPGDCPARLPRKAQNPGAALRCPRSILLVLVFAAAGATAKLPPPSDEAKAKAAEAAAKGKWNDAVAAYKLCQVQDKLAAEYRAKAGKAASAPMETPPCKDPGPFTYAAADRPIEQSGAHSPANTATQPPSTTTPQAGQKKQ